MFSWLPLAITFKGVLPLNFQDDVPFPLLCRELSIVIVEIDTGASADKVLQVVRPRDQGNSSRSSRLRPLWMVRPAPGGTLAAVDPMLRESGARGWDPGWFHLKSRRDATAAGAPGTCRRRCCPAVPPAPPRSAASPLAGPGPRRGWGRWGRKGASEAFR